VAYDLTVRLTKDAPVGYIHDHLVLVTNDKNAPEIMVEMDGRVASAITVSPAPLFMGVVHPGQTVKKQIVVRGRKPFKIVDVKCEDKSFTIKPGEEAKPVHLVPVQFKAEGKPGKVEREITLLTDSGSGDELVFKAVAQVVADQPSDESAEEEAEDQADEPATESKPVSSESSAGEPTPTQPFFEPKKKAGG
jgi:hypothetical protein